MPDSKEKIKSSQGFFSPSDIYKKPPSKKQRVEEQQWQGMPEYIMNDLSPFLSIVVHFRSKKDVDEFSKLLGQKISTQKGKIKKSFWFPKENRRVLNNKMYVDEDEENS